MSRLLIFCLTLLIGTQAVADEKEDMLNAAAKTFDQVHKIYRHEGMDGLQQAVQQCYQEKVGFICLVVDGMSFWIDQAVTRHLKMPATPFFERSLVVGRYVRSGEIKTKQEGNDTLDGIVGMTAQAFERSETYQMEPAEH